MTVTAKTVGLLQQLLIWWQQTCLGDEGGDCAKSVGEANCSGDGYASWPAAEQLLESLEVFSILSCLLIGV